MKEDDRIFRDAIDGYGFVEVDQTGDGLYCTGCMTTHKRPTKMYRQQKETLCRRQVIRMYNPEEEDRLTKEAYGPNAPMPPQ